MTQHLAQLRKVTFGQQEMAMTVPGWDSIDSPRAEATTGHVQGRLGFGVFSTCQHCHYYQQTGRPRCTTHKCNSCTQPPQPSNANVLIYSKANRQYYKLPRGKRRRRLEGRSAGTKFGYLQLQPLLFGPNNQISNQLKNQTKTWPTPANTELGTAQPQLVL